jgi:hypothetical protein
LSNIQKAIDGTHVSILKFVGPFNEDYFYHKIGNNSIVCQAVVDDKKLFIGLFIGLLGSAIDSRVLKKHGFYVNSQQQGLFSADKSQGGFAPYLLGYKGYLLLS